MQYHCFQNAMFGLQLFQFLIKREKKTSGFFVLFKQSKRKNDCILFSLLLFNDECPSLLGWRIT